MDSKTFANACCITLDKLPFNHHPAKALRSPWSNRGTNFFIMPAIAIVEDNKALANTLREMVELIPDCTCAGVWHTGEDALVKIPAFGPDIVLMDINLPGIDGIETTAKLKQTMPTLQIIMFTVYLDHDKIFDALKAGACGYILKRSAATDLPRALADLAQGGAPMSPEIARRVVEAFYRPASAPTPPSTEDLNLTKRESEILSLLSTGLANKEIADKLNISTETVRVHLKRIYEKLHVHSRTEAAMKYRDSKNR
jgi:DNA-binding NarL/FixJ family response regulator